MRPKNNSVGLSMSRAAAPSAPASTDTTVERPASSRDGCAGQDAQTDADVADRGAQEAGVVYVVAGVAPMATAVHGQVGREAGDEGERRPVGARGADHDAGQKVVRHEHEQDLGRLPALARSRLRR